MRRMLGAYVAGVVALAGVLVAAPASADVTGVELYIVSPANINDSGVLLASLVGDKTCPEEPVYNWDFDGDGTFGDIAGGPANNVNWSASQWSTGPGTYTVGVRVTVCGASFDKNGTITVPGAVSSFTVTLPSSVTTTTDLPVDLIPTVYNQPDGSTLSYAWELDGDAGFDDSTATYGTFTSSTTGAFVVQLRVRHSLMEAGDSSAAASTTVTVVPRVSLTAPVLPTTAKAGQTLSPTGGVATPNDAIRTWTWQREGGRSTTTSVASYRLTTADSGRWVKVRVDATRTGYGDAYAVTSNVVRVAAACTVRPTFSGTARVGRRLTGSRGTWYAPSHAFTYRWLRDGRAITGATRTTYTTTRADRGHLITFQVTARRTGFPTVTAKSAARRIS